LALIFQALKGLHVWPGPGKRGQQQRSQNGNSRDDNSQFNQRKATSAGFLKHQPV
jgi:hypothetical protein